MRPANSNLGWSSPTLLLERVKYDSLFTILGGQGLMMSSPPQARRCASWLRASVTSTDASIGKWNRMVPQSFRRVVLNARRIEDCHKSQGSTKRTPKESDFTSTHETLPWQRIGDKRR